MGKKGNEGERRGQTGERVRHRVRQRFRKPGRLTEANTGNP